MGLLSSLSIWTCMAILWCLKIPRPFAHRMSDGTRKWGENNIVSFLSMELEQFRRSWPIDTHVLYNNNGNKLWRSGRRNLSWAFPVEQSNRFAKSIFLNQHVTELHWLIHVSLIHINHRQLPKLLFISTSGHLSNLRLLITSDLLRNWFCFETQQIFLQSF
jgi:hypothetical protein